MSRRLLLTSLLLPLTLGAAPVPAGEIAPRSVVAPALPTGEITGRFSDRTIAVGIEVDRDRARVLGFTLKPRPFTRALAIPAPRAYDEMLPVQLEVALIGPGEERYTQRIDLAGLCLEHTADSDPHVAGDTIRLHRESLVVEVPELAGFDRVELAYYTDEAGLPLRKSLGADDLGAADFRPSGTVARYADLAFARSGESATAESTAASTALWPEDFGDTDIYQVFGDEAEGSRRINVVIVPDGYTYAEKAVMETHASDMVDYFRGIRPYDEHDRFMNYTLVYAYSVESGTDQCDCGIVLDTAMGTRFPLSNPTCGHSANRCLYYGGGCDTSGTGNIVAAELRAPFKDTTIVMVNTTRYGGCGGARAVYSAGNSAATDVAVHELGHTLGGLADEYAGNATCGLSAGEINTSRNEDVGAWPEWIDDLGSPWEGAQYYNQCIYRPQVNCEMRSLFQPFCAVCNQHWSLVTFGHPRISPSAPIESMTPGATLSIEPWASVDFSVGVRLSEGTIVTNEIEWRLTEPGEPSGEVVATDTTAHTVTFTNEGLYTLEVEVIADTNFVKPAKYGANRDTASWQIDVAAVALPAEVSPPGGEQPLLFEGPNRMTWELPAASGALSFNVYKGDVPDLAAGSYGSCLQSGLSTPQAIVFGHPPAGDAQFFLVTGVNSLGEGSMGQTSSGMTRTNAAPCN